jgi:hypothetical protein
MTHTEHHQLAVGKGHRVVTTRIEGARHDVSGVLSLDVMSEEDRVRKERLCQAKAVAEGGLLRQVQMFIESQEGASNQV